MKSLIKLLVCLVSLSILVTSCRKDIDDQLIIKENPPEPIINVYGNVLGKVVDEDNEPVSNAEVIYSNEVTVTTDENGLFLIQDMKMNSAGTYVQVEKQGYFNGSRRIYPEDNSTNYVEIVLLEKTILGSVSAEEGGKLAMLNGATIDLPENGIVDASGSTYNGTVNVAMQWLDPTADNLDQIMPGSLEARNEANEQVILQSYGMLAIELETTDGLPLNLGNGGQATLTFPVPDAILNSAPSTIPLWHFDEVDGLWKEEGMAELVGSEYIGQVSHFSFWNCDVPFPLIRLSGCFQGFEGGILPNGKVQVEVVSTGLSAYDNTNSQGCFTGCVPKDEVLQLSLIGKCGAVLYQEEIGALEEDTDLGTLLFTLFNDGDFITLQGSLVDCDNLPLDQGVLRIETEEGDEFFFIDNGSIDVSTTVCSGTTSVLVSASNPTEDQAIFGDPIDVPISGSIIDVGNIEACNDPTILPDTYARVTLNGDTYLWDLGAVTNGTTYAQMNPTGLEVWISFRNILPIDTTAASFIFFGLEEGPNIANTQGNISLSNFNGLFDVAEDFSLDTDPFAEKNIEITELGEVGEPVCGTLIHNVQVNAAELIEITNTGVSSFTGDTLGVFPITVDFRVIRK